MLAGKLAVLCAFSFLGVKFVTVPLLSRFDVVQEYTFLATLAWCLLWAEIAHVFGLSYELGAFIAGLSIASCRVAIAIAEHLKPLREFFLILFFFSVGTKLDLNLNRWLIVAAILFGVLLVPLKAGAFRFAFHRIGESADMSGELAVRLSQSSEFSLFIAFSAVSVGLLSSDAAMMIQITTIVTFVVSTYWVVGKYPTPISGNSALRQD
jgi:Kef-type K+ transport system membrane component KefB